RHQARLRQAGGPVESRVRGGERHALRRGGRRQERQAHPGRADRAGEELRPADAEVTVPRAARRPARPAFGHESGRGQRPAAAMRSARRRSTSRRLVTIEAAMTPTATMPIRIVETALISGVTPSRTWL